MLDPKRFARYERIYAQLKDLIEDKSPNLIAAMATICAVLHHKIGHHLWTGFYFVAGEDELHVGPYQGPVACQVLRDRGVCLHCARTRQPVVVPYVEQFPGHIACDPRSKSEIVLPVMKEDRVIAVLDIDSHKPAQFDEDDIAPLTKILSLLQPYL
ncbi:MAG: GAF domain-containing protein [Chloroflexota bacterium]|nr:GAF domain-containing protein [Chloroflexota bacterium]